MLRKLSTMVLFTSCFTLSQAQDPMFTQFYHAPLYFNPGLTGCAKNDFRANFASRMQWMNLPDPLQYYSVSADKYINKRWPSVGAMINHFNEGYIRNTQLHFLLAKSIGANEETCRDWFFNFGMQFGWSWRNADRSKLLFPDQLSINGPTGMPSQFEEFNNAKRQYFDVSSGFVFTYKSVMIGAAGHHLGKPVNGLFGGSADSRLPRRFTFHLSFFNDRSFNDATAILAKPTIIYDVQDVSRSLTIGSLFDFPGAPIEAGIWYRNNTGFRENHSICIGINIKLGPAKNIYNGDAGVRYNTGVSYDAEVTRPGIGYTKGSGELGMLFEKNLNSSVECPKPLYYGEDCRVRFPWVFH
jgi:type IX secretion system PorP/SprF family membrane protein